MAVPDSKAALLDAISTTFDRLMANLLRVPDARAQDRSMPGHAAGTLMSPSDLVAYLIGWNALVLKWLARDDAGQPVVFPEEGFNWNQLGLLAQKFQTDCPEGDWPARLERLAALKAQVVETVSRRSDLELYGSPWYGKWTKGRMIQLNTSSPYMNARKRLRAWLRDAERAGLTS
ncbi:ClbS/DfsB family four-helix bundle protein [Phaeovulum vinaykumarii]|uniref:ClbS/DfsB family four-helix bundle protein n=1 Tax=Phaeovulum vinaykumarii TaxID=407234 RepID=A0A1N7KTR6_9RHOB|nr:ClbS/DfsB family four-helix bundle protein [Phaeovulum vinaykumarii]SIS64941.1 hypothetical protein SAMN05421795_102151 [Phaeovulum vinaykumarii]SOC01461.1 hypothetical protein SAMN05878426_102623 [Phaeovulum vinaykumarii]